LKKVGVSIIGIDGLPPRYGGFETLAEHLTRILGDAFEFTVFCGKSRGGIDVYNNARLVYLPLKANGIQSILYDIMSVLISLRKSDILLVLGVSGAIILPLIRLLSNKKIIVNLDGPEHLRDKRGLCAKLYIKLSELAAIRSADVIIADNAAIQAYVKQEYNSEAILIEYGGDHASALQLNADVKAKYGIPKTYAFSVCRIEPENNIHLILEAFREAKEHCLMLVGNWTNGKYGRHLYKDYHSESNLVLLESIYNQQTLNQLRSNCRMYVHGHSAGGTNPSLVEAMALGLPVVAFDVTYNRETTENASLYFENAEQLIRVIRETTETDLQKVGAKMKEIAKRRYTWKRITNEYAKLFTS